MRVRAAARRLHYTEVSAGADDESRLGEKLSDAVGVAVILAALCTLRAAEDGDDFFAGSSYD